MKRIINWCSGGLGNRLRPLATCYAIHKSYDRELGFSWQPSPGCDAKFEELYIKPKNWLDMSYEDVAQLQDVSIYSEVPYIQNDANLYNNDTLLNLLRRFGCKTLDQCVHIRNDPAKNIIVYDNNFVGDYDKSLEVEFLKNLQPVPLITEQVESFIQQYHIDKTWIGVHARGTDYEATGTNVHTYIEQMKQYPDRNFFLCSDSKEYEDLIKRNISNVITFTKKEYTVKKTGRATWVDNVQRSKQSMYDSIVDLLILSKTDVKIYNRESTFAQIATLI